MNGALYHGNEIFRKRTIVVEPGIKTKVAVSKCLDGG